jgi:hypothetical protein
LLKIGDSLLPSCFFVSVGTFERISVKWDNQLPPLRDPVIAS